MCFTNVSIRRVPLFPFFFFLLYLHIKPFFINFNFDLILFFSSFFLLLWLVVLFYRLRFSLSLTLFLSPLSPPPPLPPRRRNPHSTPEFAFSRRKTPSSDPLELTGLTRSRRTGFSSFFFCGSRSLHELKKRCLWLGIVNGVNEFLVFVKSNRST